MTTKQAKLLTKLWASWQCGPEDQTYDCRKLYKLTLAESNDHDRYRGHDIRRGMTVMQEAKYFALKRLAEFSRDETHVV